MKRRVKWYKFWRVLNLASDQNGILGEDRKTFLIWQGFILPKKIKIQIKIRLFSHCSLVFLFFIKVKRDSAVYYVLIENIDILL